MMSNQLKRIWARIIGQRPATPFEEILNQKLGDALRALGVTRTVFEGTFIDSARDADVCARIWFNDGAFESIPAAPHHPKVMAHLLRWIKVRPSDLRISESKVTRILSVDQVIEGLDYVVDEIQTNVQARQATKSDWDSLATRTAKRKTKGDKVDGSRQTYSV
jgi:hypothetical protein